MRRQKQSIGPQDLETFAHVRNHIPIVLQSLVSLEGNNSKRGHTNALQQSECDKIDAVLDEGPHVRLPVVNQAFHTVSVSLRRAFHRQSNPAEVVHGLQEPECVGGQSCIETTVPMEGTAKLISWKVCVKLTSDVFTRRVTELCRDSWMSCKGRRSKPTMTFLPYMNKLSIYRNHNPQQAPRLAESQVCSHSRDQSQPFRPISHVQANSLFQMRLSPNLNHRRRKISYIRTAAPSRASLLN